MKDVVYYRVLQSSTGYSKYYRIKGKGIPRFYDISVNRWIKTYYLNGEQLKHSNKSWGNSIKVISKRTFERNILVEITMQELVN